MPRVAHARLNDRERPALAAKDLRAAPALADSAKAAAAAKLHIEKTPTDIQPTLYLGELKDQ